METIISKLESWNNTIIRETLAELNDKALEKALLDRYKNILKLVKGKSLEDLINLPKNILKEEALTKRWKPNEKDFAILASLPITKIDINFHLKKIPTWFEYLNLEQIEIFRLRAWGRQSFKEIPSWLASCSKLDTLHLAGVEFKKKASLSSLSELSNLETLNIEIDEWLASGLISKSPTRLKNLAIFAKETSLGATEIYQICSELGNLQTLEELTISGFELEDLPESWRNLTQLKALSVSSPVTQKFISSTKEELGCWPAMVGDLLSAEAMQNFFSVNFQAEEERTEEDYVFDFLESGEEDKIKKALAILERHPKLKAAAEERYLELLKLLLDKEDASLEDLLNLKETEKLLSLIQEFAVINPQDLTNKFMFDYKEGADCLKIVQILGALTKNAIDMSSVLAKVGEIEDEYELTEYVEEIILQLKTYLRKEFSRGLLSSGWLQKILEKFNCTTNFSAKELRFNHTDFEQANDAKVLDAFFFFILAHSISYDHLYIDIAQSTAVDLTFVYWLFPYLPNCNCLDTEEVLPNSVLRFERS